jgi:hypothetical protein
MLFTNYKINEDLKAQLFPFAALFYSFSSFIFFQRVFDRKQEFDKSINDSPELFLFHFNSSKYSLWIYRLICLNCWNNVKNCSLIHTTILEQT